jgi:hypothetical protein
MSTARRFLSILLLAFPLCFLKATDQTSQVIRFDSREIEASLAQREQWIIDQAKGSSHRAKLFSGEYEWLLSSNFILTKEAKQLAYLFFASTGAMGGYFDDPVLVDGVYIIAFHSELGPIEGFPVFVEAQTGLTWQKGQKEKIDTLALIRLFAKHRKLKE